MSIRAFALTAGIFGAAWGFFDFAICGAIVAWLYNKIKK